MNDALPDGIRFEGDWPDVKIIWPNGNSRGATRPEFLLWRELIAARSSISAMIKAPNEPDSPESCQWRPIESCPYETWVLMWFVTVPGSRGEKAPDAVVMGQRSVHERGKFWDGNIFRPLAWVTHWKPIPTGPHGASPSFVWAMDATGNCGDMGTLHLVHERFVGPDADRSDSFGAARCGHQPMNYWSTDHRRPEWSDELNERNYPRCAKCDDLAK